jgi:hypothetical protein
MTRVKKVWVALIGLLLLGQTQVFSQKKISIAFDVQLADYHTVTIQWTRPEADSFDYVLEKSGDEKTWARIANIYSQLSPCYDYIDLHAAEGINYYRIVQRKHEEMVAVSATKKIQTHSADKLYIWPTPANDIVHVRSPFVNGNIDIIASDGQLIRKISITDLITDVSLQALPSGMYFIHVRHGKDILIDKFIKQQGF